VKFINKEHAFKQGRLKPQDLQKEISLHQFVSNHQNIIKFYNCGDDAQWMWIALELAEGGDLFDKVEADEGVGTDVAHFYFMQLIQAVSFMHSKGVAHRDLKPENILLSGEGDLKIADFGLATLFQHNSQKKRCTTVCGSPPYIAPEILQLGGRRNPDGTKVRGYEPDLTDIWSCGIILFVLLVGNTPWDEPTRQSYEFNEYVESNGRPQNDELWDKIDPEPLSLLHGILKIDPQERYDLEKIRKHPWFTRSNPYLRSNGRAADQIALATKMLESLHINFNAPPTASQDRSQADEAMDVDTPTNSTTITSNTATAVTALTSTQPQTPLDDNPFDWERPNFTSVSASQPTTTATSTSTSTPTSASASSSTNISASTNMSAAARSLAADFDADPTLSQFHPTPSVPLTLTQAARKFHDIVPAASLCRFLSAWSFSLLLPRLAEALQRLGIPVAGEQDAGSLGERAGMAWLRVKIEDGRRQRLTGHVVVERIRGDGEMQGQGQGEVLEVRFLKAAGDPLEWRRLFKKVVVLCQDVVLVPGM
jgi:serine/threonine-protein kinase CHEK1